MLHKFITFEARGGLFGLGVDNIREIRAWAPVTRMPNVPHYMLGVINLRGAILPVMDLAARVGWEATEATGRHAIIVAQLGDKSCGIIVESVSDIVDLDTETLQPVPSSLAGGFDADAIDGIAPINDRLVLVLNPAFLLSTSDSRPAPCAEAATRIHRDDSTPVPFRRQHSKPKDNSMTPEQIDLVQSSWAKVAPIADQAADIFYGHLFENNPAVRSMFSEDMSKQKKALMGMLAVAVNGLDKLDTILPAVQELGRRHVAYGAMPEHYGAVAGSLLHTLGAGLGNDFTPEVKEAWTAAYNTLASVMIDAAKEAKAA